MRIPNFRSLPIVVAAGLVPTVSFAQEGGGMRPFMQPDTGLMVWTLAIFIVLMFVLSRYAFGPLTKAVQAREKSLQTAIDAANADRAAAAALLADHQAKIEAARDEAQKLIVDARGVSEKMRTEMIEQTRKEQQDILARANRDIAAERDKAIAQLRREAVDLALAGASKVIEQNLESAKNRALVESYLASIGSLETAR
ncbi:MAG TPA: F0F1 ATP synthase subunit B [Gemmatimonadaceae bacterium]|nr:F0F1 ATP synthase subunit B [Gemmatimonadaceae bacterium]